MKTKPINSTVCLVLAGVFALAAGGCSATATRESTGEYIDDSGITTKVKSALLGDPQVKSFEIKVKTFRGVVQLSGFVDNQDEMNAAVRDAQGVGGVRSVDDNIALKAP